MQTTKKRVAWLDTVRALAIVLVICNHSIERAYALGSLEEMLGYALHSRLIALSFFTLARLGVPLFFFLSGYLLLDRDYDAAATKRYFKRNVLGLLVTTEIWILGYNLFNSWQNGTAVQPDLLWKNMLLLQNVDMSHMWYMPVILGIYLFVPFVANALRGSDVKSLYLPALAAFVYLFVRAELNVLLAACGRQALGSALDVSFSGGSYGFYLIVGYLVKKGVFDRVPNLALWVAVPVCYGSTLAVECFSYARGVKYNVWYDNATLLLAALALFLLLARKQPVWPGLESLSRCSFGIYLVHNLILILLAQRLQLPARVLKFGVLLVLTLVLSWALVWLVSRQRQLGRWLFFIK